MASAAEASAVVIDDSFEVFFEEAAKVIKKLQKELTKDKEKVDLVPARRTASEASPEDDSDDDEKEWMAQMQADGRYPAYFESLQRQAAFWLATSTATTEDLNAFNEALQKLTNTGDKAVHTGKFHLDTLIGMAARQLRRLLLVYPATREERLFIRTFNCGRSVAPFFEATAPKLVSLLVGFLVVVARSPSRVMARQLSADALTDLLQSLIPLVVVAELERKGLQGAGLADDNEKEYDKSKLGMLKNLLKVLATSVVGGGGGGGAPAAPALFNIDRTTYLSALLRLFTCFTRRELSSAAATEPARLYNLKVAELLHEVVVSQLKSRVEQQQPQKLEELVDLDRLLFELHKFYQFYEGHNRSMSSAAAQLLCWNHHALGSIQSLLDLLLEVKGERLWEHISLIEKEVVSSSSNNGKHSCRSQPLLYTCMIERGYGRPDEADDLKKEEIELGVSSTTDPDVAATGTSKKAAAGQEKGKKSTATKAMEVAKGIIASDDIEVVSIVDCYPKPKVVHDSDDDEEDENDEKAKDDKQNTSTATPSSSFEMLELEEQATTQKNNSSNNKHSLAHLRQRREPRKSAKARK